jgi:amino acid transporter
LPYTIYAFYFVILFNSGTNTMRFADYVWQCAAPGTPEDERFIRFLAVVILTFFCVLHFRSARMARALNVALAGFKIIMLLIVFVAGAVKASKQHVSWSNNPSDEASSTAAAFLLILFSFSGWENATFVRTRAPVNMEKCN